ncbi:MAG: alpha/beta hydrolase [Acetobacteraceae bacterium]|nr:alpha/beta hydrolase [Acetobacteraceae bacterium]
MHAKVSADLPPPGKEPLVLVHGLGLSHVYMMPVAEYLAVEFPVYVPDLAGFGESEHPKQILDVAGLAAGLEAWLGAVGLGPVSMLANSHGCQIVGELAVRWPGRVNKSVLQGPTTPPEERGWMIQFVRWRQNNRYNPPELGPISYHDYHRAGYGRALRTFHLALRDRLEDKIPAMTGPVLIVRGQHDPICQEAWAEELAGLAPDGQLAIIPGVAHTLCYAAPEQLATVTVQFLREGLPAV